MQEELKDMRQQVKDLEEQKNVLVKQNASSSCSTLTAVPTNPTDLDSALTTMKLQDYVKLSAEVEAFRCQNANLVEQLVQRDLLYSVLRTGLLEFERDKVIHRFTPLTREEGVTCMKETLVSISIARLLYANDESFQDRPTMFGWSQYCERHGGSFNFAVKKSLPNTTPRQLADSVWRFVLDSKVLNSLGPSQIKADVKIVQKITDDTYVLDRRTEDSTRMGVDGKPLILRTIYLAFRSEESDGAMTVALKTIDLPLTKRLLREDETWCDIFYWMHYSVNEYSDVPTTASEFGGSNTYATEKFAASWLEEVLFLAIRWESLVFPSLLE